MQINGYEIKPSANLRGANLHGSDLRGATLCDAKISGATLRGANLYGADLRGADLSAADLSAADLSAANLYGTDLSAADLRGATLCDANLASFNTCLLYLDVERQYILKAFNGNVTYYIAGCRTFTYEEAINHWTNVSIQPAYVAAIEAHNKKLSEKI